MKQVSYQSIMLYSGTVFTLECNVVLVSEVDTTVTVLTSWSKDGSNISSTDRISVDIIASHVVGNIALQVVYVSGLIFNPLSNMESGGDDGSYTCSAQVMNDTYITGSDNSGTANITTVRGQ